MTKPTLAERVSALEKEVADLRAALANGTLVKDWRSTVGMFSGDETMKRICDYALEYREKDRQKVRQLKSATKPRRR